MTKFGKMTAAEWSVYYFNRFAIGIIRLFKNRQEKLFNYYLSLILRFRSRLTGRTFFGASIDCDLNDYIPKRIFFFGVWEPLVSEAIVSVLRPGDTFVDIGANIGYDSLLASKLVGSSGKVVAIEAATDICDQLRENLRRNGVHNARPVNVAVSDVEGTLTLYAEGGANLGRTSSHKREGFQVVETVPMLPLDAILTVEERLGLRLIKIDIEGGESPVLERIIETLHMYPANLQLIVEISDEDSGRSKRIFEKLLASGYAAFSIHNDYSLGSYLSGPRKGVRQQIDHLPDFQIDVHFLKSFDAARSPI